LAVYAWRDDDAGRAGWLVAVAAAPALAATRIATCMRPAAACLVTKRQPAVIDGFGGYGRATNSGDTGNEWRVDSELLMLTALRCSSNPARGTLPHQPLTLL
jgi:hypothetical protein